MTRIIALGLLLALAGCGVSETASVAATAAEMKAQEIKQAKQSQAQFQQKLDQANLQLQQSANAAGGDQ